ncbi:MAG TPA: hypothetical protein VMW49_09080 [Candidatus Dormibacteraeota bacterium]|nr:hypothetical protein [Candidatus Dormibacteraeota bacterium]
MAIQRPRRGDDVVRYPSADADYEVEVSHALNKWCVSVRRLADRTVVAEDFYPERWKAMARAQDFLRILNMRSRPTAEGDGDEGGATAPPASTPPSPMSAPGSGH